MKLGIDFGTTRIVVAAADRGNYPVVSFEAADGDFRDWFPPLIAVAGGQRLYGWQAWAAQSRSDVTVIRSIKRTLEDAGPGTLVRLGEQQLPVGQVLTEMVQALKTALLERSTLPRKDALQTMLGVPANANSNQRFLTVEPFQRAGIEVIGLLNEPSAASIEYGHVVRGTRPGELVLVYDLGGGTFDASLVEITDKTHTVLATEGISSLGGDDFDILLGELALERADIGEDLSAAEIFLLHEECRMRKEALHPNTRRIPVDLGVVREEWDEVSIPAAEYYERCRPLVESTLEAVGRLLSKHESGRKLDAVYVTGGGSELPLVSRVLKEQFGRRVRRSPYTRSATAIGLAIQADEQTGYVLQETFTRHFGVWREADAGRTIVFDPLFEKGTLLPAAGQEPLKIERSYHPAHNIGHFRYLECSDLKNDGRPAGDIAVWDEIRFPFDPAVSNADLLQLDVQHCPNSGGQFIQETYLCGSNGAVEVRIANLTSSYERTYRLGKWSGKSEVVTPGRKKRSAKQ